MDNLGQLETYSMHINYTKWKIKPNMRNLRVKGSGDGKEEGTSSLKNRTACRVSDICN